MSSDQSKLCSNMKVEFLCKKWVKPATPTPSHLHKLMLSSIDQLMPPKFVRLILHFDTGKDTEVLTIPENLRRLEESLSKVLTIYYPFAGGYHQDELAVSCQDQGVEFIVATVDRKLPELADGEYDKEALVSGLCTSDVAWTPVVSVQVNVFTCGRIAIGLSFLHKVTDMFTFSTFMDAWATAARLGTLDHVVRPSFSLSSLMPPKDTLKAPTPLKTTTEPQPPPRFVSKRYVFTEEAISKLKKSAMMSNNNNNNVSETKYSTNYSRVELVMALITRNLINIEYSKGAKLRPLVIVQPMNLRRRTTLPIEENSFGNIFTLIMAAQDVENESWEIRQLAELIHNSVRNVASEIGKLREWNELSDRVVKSVMEFIEVTRKGDEEVNLVKFTSWCRFPLYEIDFGCGKPSLVATVASPYVIIYLMDHKGDGGGIEAWVYLKEDDMAHFQQEMNIILAYASS